MKEKDQPELDFNPTKDVKLNATNTKLLAMMFAESKPYVVLEDDNDVQMRKLKAKAIRATRITPNSQFSKASLLPRGEGAIDAFERDVGMAEREWEVGGCGDGYENNWE